MVEPRVVGSTAAVWAGLAGGGRVGELGIGTWRSALPLAVRGYRLWAKPGGDAIGISIGYFVIKVMVPGLRRLPPGQNVVPFHVGDQRLGFDVYDVVTQAMSSHHVKVADGKGTYRAIPFRYVWPAELDLMAQLAGMVPHGRWAGWTREPFTAESSSHVSVWRKPTT